MEAAPASHAPRLSRALGHGADLERRARRRGERLMLLARADVLAPEGIEADADGRVSALLPVVDGMDLAELARHREPLTAAECVWLGRRIARAVAAMHAAGLVHGDLSPANVVLRHGGVTVVDTLGAVRQEERGTAGFRAPERVAGDAVEASDVYSLGRLLRWAVRQDDLERMRSWTLALVAPDADIRPHAAALDALLGGCTREEPVEVPAADLAHAVRSRALARTERLPQGRWWRAWRWTLRGAGVTGAVGIAVALGVGVPRIMDRDLDSASALEASALEASAGADAASVQQSRANDVDQVTDPAGAAATLTEQRIAALSAGDGDALEDVVTGESAVARAARQTAGALESGETVYEGLDVAVTSAHVIGSGDSDDGTAEVEVTYRLSDHTITDTGGAREVGALDETAILTLVRVDDQWKVADATSG